MLKISYASFLCLSQLVSLLKCVSQPEIAKKIHKTPILAFKVIQGHNSVAIESQCTTSY